MGQFLDQLAIPIPNTVKKRAKWNILKGPTDVKVSDAAWQMVGR
jgi:hypothetical protein